MKILGVAIVICQFISLNVMAQNLYFSNPHESVQMSSKFLIDENWEALANYYSLDGVDKDIIDSLKDGSYFINEYSPEIAHPGGFWKYRHPFPPEFKYVSHIGSGDTIKVELSIEIDQGNGMIQEGKTFFYLKKSRKGYQHIL